jgi:hypothetical protein
MGGCNEKRDPLVGETLLPKQVDDFYQNLFDANHIDETLVLDQGKICSRIQLNHKEIQQLEFVLKRQNVGSRQ